MADFWTDGSLPTPADLRAYLASTGLPDEAVDAIVTKYNDQIVGNAGVWVNSKAGVNDWVEREVRVVTNTAQPDTGNAMSDLLNNARGEEDVMRAEHQALADQRSETITNQVQSYYDQANAIQDAGAAYGAGMSTSLALGFRTDEYGNMVIDPETGAPIPLSPEGLWSEISGLRFNMGELALPYPAHRSTNPSGIRPRSLQDASIRAVEGSVEGPGRYRNRRSLDAQAGRYSRRANARFKGDIVGQRDKRVLTPTQAMGMLNEMPEDYLMRIQQEMLEAGLYERVAGEGAIPSWGRADSVTRKAFIELFTEASTDPTLPIDQLLNQLAAERITRRGADGEDGAGGEGTQLPDFTPEVTSAETLRQSIDEIARSLRGEFASPEEREALVKTLQDKEVAAQRKAYDISIGNIRQQAGMQGAGAGGDAIDAFMAAVAGKESGGDYSARNPDSGAYGKFQIMPANWAPWAERAGLGADAPRTPENQEIVARSIMLDYYRQFGNWRDVAVAWYAGPGRVSDVRNSTRAQGKYPSIAAYADDVMSRFGRSGAARPSADGTYGGNINDPIERFDPAAEAQAILKAQDPTGWEAHEYANRAIEFFGLLGGAV